MENQPTPDDIINDFEDLTTALGETPNDIVAKSNDANRAVESDEEPKNDPLPMAGD